MNIYIPQHKHVSRHQRDVDLFGRLFAEWTKGRAQLTAKADQRLDEIEVQLVRLERTVTMAAPAVRSLPLHAERPLWRRAAVPPAALRT